ncbi:MAG: recombinase family protein [Nitrolancea sp.]
MQQTKRAAIYVRVSSAVQEEDGTSLQTQEAAARAHAARAGCAMDEAHVYREVHTGVELWQRPVLTAMRDAIRHHEFDVLVCYAIDRLARDPVHLGVILSEAEHHGVDVDFVTEPLDSSPEGQLIRFVRGYAAKVEHAKFRERSMRGRRARAEAGKLVPGPRPRYGYQWNDESKACYLIDPVAGAVVRRIFSLALDGASIRHIGMILNDEQIPAPRGGQWRHTTIRGILRDATYTGQACAWRYESQKMTEGGYQVHARAEDQRIELPSGTVPALVDASTFAAVQARLDTNKARSIRNTRNPEEALLRAGFVRCGYCGRTLRVTSGGTPRHARYSCQNGEPDGIPGCQRHSIRAETLDAAVWARVESILTRPEIIEDELAKLRANDPTEQDVGAVDRSRAEIERRRRNLARVAAQLDDPDAAAPLVAELRSVTERLRSLDAEREEIMLRRLSWERALSHLVDLRQWCEQVAAKLTTLTWEQKRIALEALGVDVRVFRKNDPEHPRYIITANVPLSSGTNEFSLGE